jgi:hypothetical protein
MASRIGATIGDSNFEIGFYKHMQITVTPGHSQYYVGKPMLQTNVSKTSLLAGPFWLRKITTDPHILGHVNIFTGRYVSKFKNLNIRTYFT